MWVVGGRWSGGSGVKNNYTSDVPTKNKNYCENSSDTPIKETLQLIICENESKVEVNVNARSKISELAFEFKFEFEKSKRG